MENHIGISLYDESRGHISVDESSDNYRILRYPCCKTTQACTPYVITLSQGIYRFELFGASGGYPNNQPNLSGLGSYTSGYLINHHVMKLYVYLGQQGTLNGPRTFNGGSRGATLAGSGGGSSDIRLVPGEWDNFESLKSRIMVAAGGVGGIDHTNVYYIGKHGGNLTGFDGILTFNPAGTPKHVEAAKGATQERGGISGRSETYIGDNGKFGMAGDPSSIERKYSSGGSGGYFGGAGGSSADYCVGTGSSGSSFISGHPGCNAILNTSSSQDNIYLSNQSVHYSRIKFFSTVIKSGYESYTYPTDEFETKGNFGNGYAVITLISNDLCSCKYNSNPLRFYLFFQVFISC